MRNPPAKNRFTWHLKYHGIIPEPPPEPMIFSSPRAVIFACGLGAAAVLLFFRLGHYPLWDDEAYTALAAKAVAQTGDTSIVVGHNIVAFRDGILADRLKDRFTPPLAAFFAAPFIGASGTSALVARAPFAVCGFAAIGLILWWARRATIELQSLITLAVLCNVPLLLYLRQCRYYALNIFLTLAVAYVYLHWRGRRWDRLLLPVLLVLLFAANFASCLALGLCLIVDYAFWRRHEQPLRWREWLGFAPAAITCAAVAWVWNPYHTRIVQEAIRPGFTGRLKLWCLYWRDTNSGEVLVGALLCSAVILGLFRRHIWLRRGSVAFLMYVSFITLVSPQNPEGASMADLRHISPVIPLAAFLSALALTHLARGKRWLMAGLGIVSFGTNIFNGGPWLQQELHSSIVDFCQELLHPPADPYSAAAQWLTVSTRPEQSVWVLPDYMAYPLMYHVPQLVYAWQLNADNHEAQFAQLPPINFEGRIPPDYIMIFGPSIQSMREVFSAWARQDVIYQQVATLDCFV